MAVNNNNKTYKVTYTLSPYILDLVKLNNFKGQSWSLRSISKVQIMRNGAYLARIQDF